MTTMTITLEQPNLADEIKTLIAKLKGVLSVSVSDENIPNKTTRKVIEDALKGKNVTKCENFEDYLQKMN